MARSLSKDMPDVYKIYQTNSIYEIYDLIINKSEITFVICSLWKSVIIGLIFTFFSRKKFILLLHRSEPAHLLDRVVHYIGMRFADIIIADCTHTLQRRVPDKLKIKTHVGLPQVKNSQDVKSVKIISDSWDIVYVGRIHADKNVQDIINFYQQLKMINDKFQLHLYGPLEDKSLCKTVDAYWRGPLSPDDLEQVYKKAHFVINLSVQEGFSIAVAEAMCFAVVPITFGAGEMNYYCNDGNSILTRNKNVSELVAKVANIKSSAYLGLSENAVNDIKKYIINHSSLKDTLKKIMEDN